MCLILRAGSECRNQLSSVKNESAKIIKDGLVVPRDPVQFNSIEIYYQIIKYTQYLF